MNSYQHGDVPIDQAAWEDIFETPPVSNVSSVFFDSGSLDAGSFGTQLPYPYGTNYIAFGVKISTAPITVDLDFSVK